MWFLFALLHVFFLALVNYIDEYLTRNNKLPKTTNIHTKIGGLLLISTLFCFFGAAVLFMFLGNVIIPGPSLMLSILSAIPMVITFALYFYLLTLYPVYQVLPLFQLTSIWLLIIEISFGGVVTLLGLTGILIMILGAYLLDAGTFKLQAPTKLILIAIPSTMPWAVTLIIIRIASESAPSPLITFWQLIGGGLLGIILFFFVKTYRQGLLFRIRKQGKNFLGFSFLNESLSQTSYFFGNFAVALAPVATYVSAMSGVQSIFLLTLFILFPQGDRTRVSKIHIFAILLIAIGIFLIEGIR